MYQFIENIRSDRAFFFYAGRVALYAVLKAMGIGQGDEVISQVFTCFRVANPIVRLGAAPVYVDIDPATFSIDPSRLEEKITDRTRVIIVQHTFGIPAEMGRILDVAREHNLWVIEDCCHALGSRYAGQEVGTFADAAFYSFGWHKPLVLGGGGAAVVNAPILRAKVQELYDKEFATPPLRELIALYLQYAAYVLLLTPAIFASARDIYRSQHMRRLMAVISRGRRKEQPRDRGAGGGAVVSEDVYDKRIVAFQERRLFRKLDQFDSMVAHQEWVVSQYGELLSQNGYEIPKLDGRLDPVYYKYPLLSDHRQAILEKARQARIELSEMFTSPLYPAWHKRVWEVRGYRAGMCPVSESISERIVPLSVHAKIRTKEIERTAALLASFR